MGILWNRDIIVALCDILRCLTVARIHYPSMYADGLLTEPSPLVLMQMKRLFQKDCDVQGRLKIVCLAADKWPNVTDCGLYAIAFALEVVAKCIAVALRGALRFLRCGDTFILERCFDVDVLYSYSPDRLVFIIY